MWTLPMRLRRLLRLYSLKTANTIPPQRSNETGPVAGKRRCIWTLSAARCGPIAAARGKWLALDAGTIQWHPLFAVHPRKPIKQGMKLFGMVDNYTGIQSHATLPDKVLTAQNRQDSPAGAADAYY